MTDAQFRQFVLVPVAGTVGGKLNRWYGLGGRRDFEDHEDEAQVPWCCDALATGSCARNP